MQETKTLEPSPYLDRFVIQDPAVVYLDGNSLGRLAKQTAERIDQVVGQEWGNELISSWNRHWLSLGRRLGDKIGLIIGSKPGETIVCDSTSINLFKLAWGLMGQRGNRTKIITDRANFPTDLYILESVAKLSNADIQIEMVDFDDATHQGVDEKLAERIDDSTALVCLSHVQYKSGYAFDMQSVTQKCRSRGVRTLWDLSHSVGVLPMQLADWGVDAAVGCTYKYLNGGPGAPAFLYLKSDLQGILENPIAGWFGAAEPFAFGLDYEPHPRIERFLVGTPPVLSTSAIEPGLDLILEAGLDWIRERSIALSEYFIQGFDRSLGALGYRLATPRDASMRGSHVSVSHPQGWQITQDLVRGYRVIPDFRGPDVIRLGFAPLYNQACDVERAIDALQASVQSGSFKDYSPERLGVT